MLPMGMISRVERLKTPGAATDAILADARETFAARLGPLEQRLEGRDFLVAGRLTLADISVGFALYIAMVFGIDGMLGPRTKPTTGGSAPVRRSSARRRFPEGASSLALPGPPSVSARSCA